MVGQRRGMRSRHRGPSCGPLGDSSLKTSEIVIPTSRPAGRASGQRRQKCSLSRARTRQPHSAGRPDRASRRSTHIRLITGPRTEAGASHGWGRRTGRDSRVVHGQRQPASGAAGPQRTRQPRVAQALRGRVGGREAARRKRWRRRPGGSPPPGGGDPSVRQGRKNARCLHMDGVRSE